jgi:hypothetical protein
MTDKELFSVSKKELFTALTGDVQDTSKILSPVWSNNIQFHFLAPIVNS